MTYVGDVLVGATVRGFFNTRDQAGAPDTLGGGAYLSIIKDDSTSVDSTVSLTVDFGSVVGLNLWEIDTSAVPLFFTAGSDYAVMLILGAVDTVSVQGVVVGSFSVQNRSLTTVATKVTAILALLDDARAEPGQGAPPVNADLATKVDYLYKFLRNRITQTAGTLSVYADDGTTVDHKATTSDDGTTYARGEFGTGP